MMKWVEFSPHGEDYPRLGVVVDERVIEIGESDKGTLMSLITHPHQTDLVADIRAMVNRGKPILRDKERRVFALADVRLHPPIRKPPTLRDFYAFEAHVRTANQNRGREVPPVWYEIPVFYFSNTGSILGHDEPLPYPKGVEKLDYELEIACIIGKEGRDIPADTAEDYIFGYTIMNDWSARDLQAQEMTVGLGPAKGKDFATSLGGMVVMPHDLAPYQTGRTGVYDATLIARVNGVERSRGNWRDIYYDFGQLIARASQNVTLYPGDVIGSGTVGTGCLLEITRAQGPWLQIGDVVELEIEHIGFLRNKIVSK